MASRLLARLDAALVTERRPLEQLMLRAERAGLLARSGRVQEARAAVLALRGAPTARTGRVGDAALGLAEALIEYHSDLSVQARSRLQAAYAASAGHDELQATCAAWLAHLDYVGNELPGMVANAALALKLAAPQHHGARSRASLVVAMSYHHAGRFDLARPWYEQARRHARAEGDEAQLSALLHDMAALSVYLAREQAVRHPDPACAHAVLQAAGAAESSGHFDAHIGSRVLPVLAPILRAQALSIQGRFPQAMAHYEGHLRTALAQGLARIECSLRADMAWCRLGLAQPDLAREQARAAEAAQHAHSEPDELAFSHGRLAQVWAALGEPHAAERHAQAAARQWLLHGEDQARILALLAAAGLPAVST